MFSVSVIIPTYNGSRHLTNSIQSVLDQTYNLHEIIIVDDGSQEDIKKILYPFLDRVRYVRQENAGPGAARNFGVSLASGDLIAFLDDDDIWHPTKTAKQIEVMDRNADCALVYSYPELIDENGRVIQNILPSVFPTGNVYKEFLKKIE